jgi:hypothetical protein|uniref:Uncharacterized protein n=1 Tax=Globisporangium ultimum (strain ATCC 200006 / CBS 805.95 / DAOM BR144) TaxID=431595 RepID=K3X6F3_GLOUD
MSAILEPSESINYNFVAGVYGFFAVLCGVLAVAQRFTDAVEGFYITLLPFVPLLFWSLVVRAKWLKTRASKEEQQTDGTAQDEPKKDK